MLTRAVHGGDAPECAGCRDVDETEVAESGNGLPQRAMKDTLLGGQRRESQWLYLLGPVHADHLTGTQRTEFRRPM